MTAYWRAGLMTLGVLVGVYGAYLELTRLDFADIVSAVVWLVGGVVVHDAVLSVAVVVVGVVAARAVPRVARGPVVAGAIVLGTLTVVAIPFLGRFGAEASNPTLLDRSYWGGWWVLVALVVVGVVVATVLRVRRGDGAERSAAGRDGRDGRRVDEAH